MSRTVSSGPAASDGHASSPDSIVNLIRTRYDALSAGERSVAELLLASPHLMSGFTATELAAAASVSKATVTRLVAKLGLDGFDELRRAAREASQAAGSPLQLMANELNTTEGDLHQLVSEALRGDLYNLSQTYSELDLDEVAIVVEWLTTARKLIFADFRKQYALAYYAAALFRAIRPDVSTLPVLGASAVDGTLDITEDDLVVTFPFRRPERDHDTLSRVVRDAGAHLIAIGDIWPAPANERAHIHLRCRTESVGVFDSFVTPISLINLLFTAAANRLGEKARARLAVLEERHGIFETFTTPRRSARDRNPRHG